MANRAVVLYGDVAPRGPHVGEVVVQGLYFSIAEGRLRMLCSVPNFFAIGGGGPLRQVFAGVIGRRRTVLSPSGSQKKSLSHEDMGGKTIAKP